MPPCLRVDPLPASPILRASAADHLPGRRRKGAAYLETAKVSRAGNDLRFDRVEFARFGAMRLETWIPAHINGPFRLRRCQMISG